MDYVCGQCIKLDWSNKERYTCKDKYWCKEGRGYKEPTDRACSYDFVLDESKKPKDSDCFITTVVCNILGYNDDCEVLTVLRDFRENFLKKDDEYIPLLLEYDQIGPKISYLIAKEKDNFRQAAGLLKFFLQPCVKKIKERKYEEAIDIYRTMVMHLKDSYGLEEEEIEIPEIIDIKNLGKARKRVLIKKEEVDETI